jgi:hypothetical protein
MRASLILGLSILTLSGCTTHQTLPHAIISGRVVDFHSQVPINGAKVTFVYPGPTRDLLASEGGSQFLPPIEVCSVLTGSNGRFSAEIPERTVRRPLIDSWSPHPDIEISKEGYETVIVSDTSIRPSFHEPEGPPKFTEWPYTDDFVVALPLKRTKANDKLKDHQRAEPEL